MVLLPLTAALALISAPAAAEPQSQRPAAPAKAKAETEYCLSYGVTVGSRIAKSECKTKKEWKREGVNVDEIAKQ